MSESPRIFISYMKADRSKAGELFDRLQRMGATPWLDERSLLLGDVFEDKIREAIDACDGFVVLLGPDFDRVGFRQREVRLALKALEKRPLTQPFILPFLVRPCRVPSWCESFHTGDPSRPTSIDDFLYSIAMHFRLPWPQGPAIAVVRIGGWVLQNQQLNMINDTARELRLPIRETIRVEVSEAEGLQKISKAIGNQRVDNVLVYSFDAIARETFENLANVARLFRASRIALRSIAEHIEFGGGHNGEGPIIISDRERTTIEERRARVASLKEVFVSRVCGSDGCHPPCNHCGGNMSSYDQLRSGGSVDYYRTLMCCSGCWWYRIDPEYWTTDY